MQTTVGLNAGIEPLSKKISELTKLVTSINCNLYKYFDVQMMSDGKSSSEELRQAMLTLSDVLNELSKAYLDRPLDRTPTLMRDINALNERLQIKYKELLETLDAMNWRVTEPCTGLILAKWPFTEQENKELLLKLKQYEQILSLKPKSEKEYPDTAYDPPKMGVLNIYIGVC
jgi:hypothetical protein